MNLYLLKSRGMLHGFRKRCENSLVNWDAREPHALKIPLTTAYLSLYEYVHTVVMLVFGESYESTAAGEYCPTGPLRGELLFLRIVLKSLKNIT